MLLTKEVDIRWNGQNKTWLIDRGYIFTKHNDLIRVSVWDLKPSSKTFVEVKCDYCKERIVSKEWARYLRDNVNNVINTDCCSKCQPIKTKECNFIKYGVESKTELPEVREKIKKSMIDKYGVDHNMKIESIRKKAEATFLKNYGETNPMKNKDIINSTFAATN